MHHLHRSIDVEFGEARRTRLNWAMACESQVPVYYMHVRFWGCGRLAVLLLLVMMMLYINVVVLVTPAWVRA